MNSRKIAGIVLIIAGVLLFLKILGVINFSIFGGWVKFWPIGLILAGAALMFRMKWLAVALILLTMVFGLVYLVSNFEVGEEREVINEIPLEDTTALDLSVGFGAGDLKIKAGDDQLIRHVVKTSDVDDPKVAIERIDDKASVSIERQGKNFPFWNKVKDEWSIYISPAVEVDLELDYGATDSQIDISGLKVRRLDIDSGATSTKVKFGNYPTDVSIDTGASSIELEFPIGAGVAITVDGGAISTSLDGFNKTDGVYYSSGYNSLEDNIKVDINAGATSIDAGFY